MLLYFIVVSNGLKTYIYIHTYIFIGNLFKYISLKFCYTVTANISENSKIKTLYIFFCSCNDQLDGIEKIDTITFGSFEKVISEFMQQFMKEGQDCSNKTNCKC